MKTTSGFCLSLLLLVMANPAYGDIARPRPEPSPKIPRIVLATQLTIVPDSKVYEARLQIPQGSLQELRAALNDTSGNNSIAGGITHSSTRTMIAGIFMFLSLSFAGVWLARSMQTRAQKTVAGVLLGTAVLGMAAIIAQANAGPQGYYYWKKLPQNLNRGTSTNGVVQIEIVADTAESSGMKLLIPTRPN